MLKVVHLMMSFNRTNQELSEELKMAEMTCSVSSDGNATEISEFLEMVLGPKQMDDYHTLVLITVFYATVFITGILGNLSVCLVIFRSSHLHTAMNYYLVSLAIADLLIIITGWICLIFFR